MDCSKITKGLVAALCEKSATAGAEDDCYIVNFDDIDRIKSVVAENVISSIIMQAEKLGFAFTTIGKSYNAAGSTFNKGTYRNTVSQTVPLNIFVKTEEAKKFVNQFIGGAKVVVILKNKEPGENGEVQYEAYGWDNGIELSELSSTIEMADGVVYGLTLSSSDTAQEATLPKSVFAGDKEATELMLKSLVTKSEAPAA